MKKVTIVLLAFWVAYGSTAYAKCNRADVKGTWNVYFGLATVVARCTIKAPQIKQFLLLCAWSSQASYL